MLAFIDAGADRDERIKGAMLVHSYLEDIALIRRIFYDRPIDHG